jgi:hypothetical protein
MVGIGGILPRQIIATITTLPRNDSLRKKLALDDALKRFDELLQR